MGRDGVSRMHVQAIATIVHLLIFASLDFAQAGNCPQGNTYADGCIGARAGAPQYPTLLNDYARRPPWNVAGVDYHVGAPAGTVFKDWRTLKANTLPGFEWDSRGYFRCKAGIVLLDGYDFTTGNAAWNIYVPKDGCAGLIVTNSKMGCIPGAGIGQNKPAFNGFNIQSTNIKFIFKNNSVDYINCQGSGGAVNGFITIGNLGCINCLLDVEYNYVRDLFNTFIGAGGSYTSFIIKYNVIENPATSEPGDPRKIHMNSLSFLASGTVSPIFTFNTTFVSQSYAGGELPQFYYNGGGTMNSPAVTNNTFPRNGCNCVSYIIHGSSASGVSPPTSLIGMGVISDNYFDPRGAHGVFYYGSFKGWSASGNINMISGETINLNNIVSGGGDLAPGRSEINPGGP